MLLQKPVGFGKYLQLIYLHIPSYLARYRRTSMTLQSTIRSSLRRIWPALLNMSALNAIVGADPGERFQCEDLAGASSPLY